MKNGTDGGQGPSEDLLAQLKELKSYVINQLSSLLPKDPDPEPAEDEPQAPTTPPYHNPYSGGVYTSKSPYAPSEPPPAPPEKKVLSDVDISNLIADAEEELYYSEGDLNPNTTKILTYLNALYDLEFNRKHRPYGPR